MVKLYIYSIIFLLLISCSQKKVTITYLDCVIDFNLTPTEEDLKYNFREVIIKNEIHSNKLVNYLEKSNSMDTIYTYGIDNRFMFNINKTNEIYFMDCFGTISRKGKFFKADTMLLKYLCDIEKYQNCQFCNRKIK